MLNIIQQFLFFRIALTVALMLFINLGLIAWAYGSYAKFINGFFYAISPFWIVFFLKNKKIFMRSRREMVYFLYY